MSQELNEVFAEAPCIKFSLDIPLIQLHPNLQTREIPICAHYCAVTTVSRGIL